MRNPVFHYGRLNHCKWLLPDAMHGSWIFCQTERVWIVFLQHNVLSKHSKTTVTCPKIVIINKKGQFSLTQSQKTEYQFWTAQSQKSDQSENLYISSQGEARNIKFGHQVNLIQRVLLGTPPQGVVMLLTHNHVILTNLFISIYRRDTIIKFGQ